jgi:hypothetical protein
MLLVLLMKQLIVTPIVLVKLKGTSIINETINFIPNLFVVQMQYSYNNCFHDLTCAKYN